MPLPMRLRYTNNTAAVSKQDMSVYDIMPLVPLAAELTRSDHLRHYNLGANEAVPFTIPETGAQVLMPNVEAIQAIFWQALIP